MGPGDHMTAQATLDGMSNTREYSRAFLVGWRLTQIHANPVHMPQLPTLVADNNGVAEILTHFNSAKQAQVVRQGLEADLSKLPGGDSPDTTSAKTTFWQHLENPDYPAPTIATSIETLLGCILADTYVADPDLAKAIVVGEQLAEYVFGPAEPDVLAGRLSEEKVRGTCSLLTELQARFPVRATAAVAGSLAYWQRWAEENRSTDSDTGMALRRQGELWRSLLTGEARADDLLELRDYRQAFGQYLHQVILLGRRNPSLWLTILVLAVVTAGGVAAIVNWAPAGAAVIAGVIAAGAGALGITWKTVAVTVGKAAALLERPMLDDGLGTAVKIAAFIPRADMTPGQLADLRRKIRKEEQTREKELRREERLRLKELHKKEQSSKKELREQPEKQSIETGQRPDQNRVGVAVTSAAEETPTAVATQASALEAAPPSSTTVAGSAPPISSAP
jgi:hypothetical protein